MNEITVLCKNLSKSYQPKLAAVRELDLTVYKGEIVALLGASGCGKTTTLRLIGGFERPDVGCISIGDRTVAEGRYFVPPEQRQVGMVFQNYALFPHLSVGENVAYGLKRADYTAQERQVRVREVLALVDLRGLETRMPHQLSGGQQQRVALARALAPRPQVLLLDEPFSGLDASLRDQVRGDVLRILRESGATAIFVTHNQDEALFMGDRIAVMNQGRVEQMGTPETVFGAPATRFVAEFMGAAFFIPAVSQAQGLETELGFIQQPVTFSVGTPVEVAARPDDLTLMPDPQSALRIMTSVYRGGSYLYEVQLPSGHLIRCEEPHTRYYPPGTAVRVALTPGHPLVYFPKVEKMKQEA